MGTGAGHLRAAKETAIRVHSIQVLGAVRGCRDRTVLQSVQVLRLEWGSYISQDPIGLMGGNPTLYGYVRDLNAWIDLLGLLGEEFDVCLHTELLRTKKILTYALIM